MPTYSLHTKRSKEVISVKNATSLEEAVEIFARIKDLSIEKFNKIYEVTER